MGAIEGGSKQVKGTRRERTGVLYYRRKKQGKEREKDRTGKEGKGPSGKGRR